MFAKTTIRSRTAARNRHLLPLVAMPAVVGETRAQSGNWSLNGLGPWSTAANDLEPGQYLCVIPRLRHTPYWIVRSEEYSYDAAKDAVNNQYKEIDNGKLREAIIQWVRQTGKKVVVCPKMTYEVDLAKELLVDPLPADVKPKIVWKDTYWIMEIEQVTGQDIDNRVLAIHNNPAAARAYLRNAMRFVRQAQADSIAEIRTLLSLPPDP